MGRSLSGEQAFVVGLSHGQVGLLSSQGDIVEGLQLPLYSVGLDE